MESEGLVEPVHWSSSVQKQVSVTPFAAKGALHGCGMREAQEQAREALPWGLGLGSLCF